MELKSTSKAKIKTVSGSSSGLSDAEVQKRRTKDGYNEIITPQISFLQIFIKQYANFLAILLIVGTILSFIVGQIVDGLVICTILIMNGLLGAFQEYKAEKLSRALRSHVPQMVIVRRNGQEVVIPRRELVTGDIIMLSSGRTVPADIEIIKNYSIIADESVLTGESVPVVKEEIFQDRSNQSAATLFSGSIIGDGSGEGRVIATGSRTRFGKIVNLVHTTKKQGSFLVQIKSLSSFLFKTTMIATVVLLSVLLTLKPQLGFNNIFLFVTALAIGIVPEMLPLISTIALSTASLKLVSQGVVIKRLTALEDLGGVEILCTDKTGTITENKLRVVDVIAPNKTACLEAAVLTVQEKHQREFLLSTSFDAALTLYQEEQSKSAPKNVVKLWQGTFDPNNRWQFSVIKDKAKARLIVKGSPETVIERTMMDKHEKQKLLLKAADLGRRGLRVLAVAETRVGMEESYDQSAVQKLQLLGLISFEDPIKPTAHDALEKARHLGIKIKILTGDSPEVALHVAREAGMQVNDFDVITSFSIQQSSPETRLELIKRASIFARVSPEQKYEIIQVLSKKNSVLFLGEGVNDAPALKTADVGIVVEEASDIAKESADIILTKADLGVIIQSIGLGRQIMGNIVKYIMITLTGNFGSLYAVSIIALVSPILPLLPTQVLLENILTDIPMIGTVNSELPKKEQHRPFRYSIRGIGLGAVVLGLVVLSSQLVFYFIFSKLPIDLFRTLWLLEVILVEFGLIVTLRTTDWFWKAGSVSFRVRLFFCVIIMLTIFAPYIPRFNDWFHLKPYEFIYLIPIFIIVLFAIVIVEVVKKLIFRSSLFHSKG